MYGSPRTRDITIIVMALGVLAGTAAWAWKRTIDGLEWRARLLIAEELNRRGALSRREIRDALAGDKLAFRVMTTLYANALASMAKDGRVVVLPDGRYAIPKPQADSPPRKGGKR